MIVNLPDWAICLIGQSAWLGNKHDKLEIFMLCDQCILELLGQIPHSFITLSAGNISLNLVGEVL